MRHAAGTSQSACSSTMTSIAGPTAARIFRNGSSARSRSAVEMSCPRLASAYGSNGQIFMPVMPCAEQIARELVGAVQERVEILVRAFGVAVRQAPVIDRLAMLGADVAVARAVLYVRIESRHAPPSTRWSGRPAAWPQRSQSAMSIAEAARTSAPLPAVPT